MSSTGVRDFLAKYVNDENFRKSVNSGSIDIFQKFDLTDEEIDIIVRRGSDMAAIIEAATREQLPKTGDELDPVATVGMIRAVIIMPKTTGPDLRAFTSSKGEKVFSDEINKSVNAVKEAIESEKYEKILDLIRKLETS